MTNPSPRAVPQPHHGGVRLEDAPSLATALSSAVLGAAAFPRDVAPVPRVAIHAFYESAAVAAALDAASADRLMARSQMELRPGGVAAARELYRKAPTPNLIIVESASSPDLFLRELDELADLCEPSTKVMVIGQSNDVGFYRELLRRSVSEYLVAPVDPTLVIRAVSGIYREGPAAKLGQVYAFVGAKGGVGSSTVAHNVGWTMARRFGSDVLLADLDLAFGTASLDFNLDPTAGIAEAIRDSGRLDEVLLERLLSSYGDHLSVLASPATLEGSCDFDEGVFDPLIEVAQASVPLIVLDVPHLWTSWAKKALASADEIVITAAPDLANLRNAKNLMTFFKAARPNDPAPKLVLNQVGVPKRPEIKPRDFAEALQAEPIACIPFDPHLFGTAANSGQMVAEVSAKGVVADRFGEIAQRISGRKDVARKRRGPLGLGSLLEALKGKPRTPAPAH